MARKSVHRPLDAVTRCSARDPSLLLYFFWNCCGCRKNYCLRRGCVFFRPLTTFFPNWNCKKNELLKNFVWAVVITSAPASWPCVSVRHSFTWPMALPILHTCTHTRICLSPMCCHSNWLQLLHFRLLMAWLIWTGAHNLTGHCSSPRSGKKRPRWPRPSVWSMQMKTDCTVTDWGAL